MSKHKFYFTNETGSFNGYDRKKLIIDTHSEVLRIEGEVTIPLREIMAVEVRPLPRAKKTMYLAIEVCGPSIERGSPTTLMFLHKNFLGYTKVEPMKAFADELAPLIKGNAPLRDYRPTDISSNEGDRLQCQYFLNVSLIIAYYRKPWYSFDKPATIPLKTLLLMLLGGTVNVLGVLLVAVPFDNVRMKQNLEVAGWSKGNAWIAYIVTTSPVYLFWLVMILRWTIFKS